MLVVHRVLKECMRAYDYLPVTASNCSQRLAFCLGFLFASKPYYIDP